MCVCVSVCYLRANVHEAVTTQSGWRCTLRKICAALNVCVCVCVCVSSLKWECALINCNILEKHSLDGVFVFHPEAFKWAEDDEGLTSNMIQCLRPRGNLMHITITQASFCRSRIYATVNWTQELLAVRWRCGPAHHLSSWRTLHGNHNGFWKYKCFIHTHTHTHMLGWSNWSYMIDKIEHIHIYLVYFFRRHIFLVTVEVLVINVSVSTYGSFFFLMLAWRCLAKIAVGVKHFSVKLNLLRAICTLCRSVYLTYMWLYVCMCHVWLDVCCPVQLNCLDVNVTLTRQP